MHKLNSCIVLKKRKKERKKENISYIILKVYLFRLFTMLLNWNEGFKNKYKISKF